MTEKRFKLAFEDFDGWAILDTIGEYSDDEDYIDWLSGQKAVDVLNHFADENEELKQFQDRVFSWIDMHLQRLPTLRDDEFESDNDFADPSLYSGAIQILETMKRELKGDVE